MYERYCRRDSIFIFIFIMCFHLATTMYERYCRREPVYFFMCLYLATTMYENSSQRDLVYFFLIYISNQARPCMKFFFQEVTSIFYYVCLPRHDHVQEVQSIFHYVLLVSHQRYCRKDFVFIFIMCFLLSTTNVIVQVIESIIIFICAST